MIRRGILLIGMIGILTGTAQAESLRYSVGVKTWLADWVAVNPTGNFRSYIGAMYGPVAIIRYQKFFVGATYLTGNLYFPSTQTDVSGLTRTNDTITAQRTDTDLTAGYYFTPNFGVVGGYKDVDFTFTVPSQPGSGFPPIEIDQTSRGPFAGLLASYALGKSRFVSYGNLTYTWLKRREGSVDLGTFGGLSGEAGLAYRMPRWPVTFAQGYKYQRFADANGTSSDTFQGLVFSAAYSF